MCFSSRQSAKRKLSQYGPEDAVPNAPTTGPLPLRDADALGDFSGLDAVESRAFALALAAAAHDTKAVDISVLDVSRVVSWTRYFVVATCFSRPQVDAAVSRMTGAAEAPPYARVLAHTPAIGALQRSAGAMRIVHASWHSRARAASTQAPGSAWTTAMWWRMCSRPGTATTMTCAATTQRQQQSRCRLFRRRAHERAVRVMQE